MSIATIRKLLGSRQLHSIGPDNSIKDAAEEMLRHKVGAVVVVDGGDLVGVLTERDIVFRCVAAGQSPDVAVAAEIMTRDPVTVSIDDPISEALAARIGNAFRHLPVMDGTKVVGLLSYRDIPAEYAMMFERFSEMASAHADDGA